MRTAHRSKIGEKTNKKPILKGGERERDRKRERKRKKKRVKERKRERNWEFFLYKRTLWYTVPLG